MFQFGMDAIERELRLGARHATEATLRNARAIQGQQTPARRAWLQLARMAYRNGRLYQTYLRHVGVDDPHTS